MGFFDSLFGGGDGGNDGSEARLPEYMAPWISGAGPQYGDNNAQLPFAAFNRVAPYFDFTQTGVTPNYWGDEGYVPYDQFAGPSGQIGYLPNVGFMYGQGGELLREGRHPGMMPLEAGFNPRLSQAMQWMDNAVPALTPFTTDALFGIRELMQGGPSEGAGAAQYFSGLPEPVYARGHDPLYTAGLGALGGAGRLFPSMLDPLTEGARRSALSGTVPVGTYQPLLSDIERRGAERQADLDRTFQEDILPGMAQRFATGDMNYGSAGERMANRLARTYGEQQRRIEQDTLGQIGNIYSGAAQDALQRQYGAMGMGADAAQNIFSMGGNLLSGQTGLEQGVIGDQMGRGLQAAGMLMGNDLSRMQVGLGALPSIQQAALSPLTQYMGMGLAQNQLENAMLADQYRMNPYNIAMNDLRNYGSLINATTMPQPIATGGGSSGSGAAGLGALFSGIGALAGGFGGPAAAVPAALGFGATGYPSAGGSPIVSTGNALGLRF